MATMPDSDQRLLLSPKALSADSYHTLNDVDEYERERARARAADPARRRTSSPHGGDSGFALNDHDEDVDNASVHTGTRSFMLDDDDDASEPSGSGSASGSNRSSSPTPSVYSLTPSMREQSYKMEHGRTINNRSDVYCLPADDEELERLDIQHELIKIITCQTYPPQLDAALADDDTGEIKSILDLGCGSGAWLTEVAHDFPMTSAVGVDLVPLQADIQLPPNCRAEVDDINLGLSHFENTFNVVHARLLASGIKDYYRMIDQISRVLRLGGLGVFYESDWRVYGEAPTPAPAPVGSLSRASSSSSTPPPQPVRLPLIPRWASIWAVEDREPGDTGYPSLDDGLWLARWFTVLAHSSRLRGGSVDVSTLLARWIGDHRAYGDVAAEEFWVPVAPWMARGQEEEEEREGETDAEKEEREERAQVQQMSEMMRDNLFNFLAAGRPMLLATGFPAGVIKSLEHNAARELRKACARLWMKAHRVCATRVKLPPPPPGPSGAVFQTGPREEEDDEFDEYDETEAEEDAEEVEGAEDDGEVDDGEGPDRVCKEGDFDDAHSENS